MTEKKRDMTISLIIPRDMHARIARVMGESMVRGDIVNRSEWIRDAIERKLKTEEHGK